MIKPFTRKAAVPNRTPGSHDFYPGTTEVPLDPEMKNDPEGYRGTYYSPQTNQWNNALPANLPKGLSEEQIFQLLKRTKNTNREQFEELTKKYSKNSTISNIVLALESDDSIRNLVNDKTRNS